MPCILRLRERCKRAAVGRYWLGVYSSVDDATAVESNATAAVESNTTAAVESNTAAAVESNATAAVESNATAAVESNTAATVESTWRYAQEREAWDCV